MSPIPVYQHGKHPKLRRRIDVEIRVVTDVRGLGGRRTSPLESQLIKTRIRLLDTLYARYGANRQ